MWWLRAALIIWQGLLSLSMRVESKEKYDAARTYADAVGKPLLVVGGPYGSFISGRLLGIKAHGYGDVCLDIDRRACEGSPEAVEAVVADIRDIPFPDGYFGACLISHVLEHLPTLEDCQRAVQELFRVADQVYVASPSKQSFWAWLVPDHYLWVSEEDGQLMVEERTWWARAAGRNPRDWD